MKLKNKIALITGSFSGIGLSIAEILAGEGAGIVLHGIASADTEQQLKKAFEKKWGTVCYTDSTDLRDATAVEKFCGRILSETNGIDILVNNAGIQHVAPVEDFSAEKWHDVIAVNLSAAFFMTKHLLPAMQRERWGRIINISSVHGLVASVNKAAYVSAKHGIIGLTKVTALENATKGITANAICPGWVETELIKKQYQTLAENAGVSVEEGKKQLIREKQPNLSFIKPEAVGELVLYLCSDAAAGITGAALPIDGAWTAQ